MWGIFKLELYRENPGSDSIYFYGGYSYYAKGVMDKARALNERYDITQKLILTTACHSDMCVV